MNLTTSHYIGIAIGAVLLILGGVQVNAALFGAKWSGIILAAIGIATPVLLYLQTQLAAKAPPAA